MDARDSQGTVVEGQPMIRRSILIGPEVPDEATLASLVARVAHYLSHVDLDKILVVLGADLDVRVARSLLESPTPPCGFSSAVRGRIARIRDSISFQQGTAGLLENAADCDVLLLWEATAVGHSPWDVVATGYRRNKTMFDVDWVTTRRDGIWMAEAAIVLANGVRRFDAHDARRFRDRTAHLVGAERAYLIATGPSARTALDRDLSDGVRIVCNTVVLDDELMAHVDPDIVTFADPIFHFGPSTYAHEFQRALERQARRHDFTIVTIERYASLLADRMPQLADRIVGVRQGNHGWRQNLDLLHELAVRPYPNILTMLMLPLATTFSRDIQMIGFDGRRPDETYFWRHGATVQLHRELEDIKSVHPGFFDLDYTDYYTEHVNALELLLRRVEQRGITVSPSTPSFMAPLRRRAQMRGLDPLAPKKHDLDPPSADLMASVTPDWVSRFGHFGPWERALGTEARRVGFDYRSLASKALVPDHENELQVFSRATISREPFDPSLFEHELRDQLDTLVHADRRSYVLFYTADIWHLPSLLAVARDHPETLFAVNLMRAHPVIATALDQEAPPRRDATIGILTACLEAAAGTNLVVCIDTDIAAAEVLEVTGLRIPTWPMITVGDAGQLERAGRTARRHHPVRVVAPIQTQQGKGFADVVLLAERMSGPLRRGRVSLSMRYVSQPTGAETRDDDLARRFAALGGELIEGDLTDDEYVTMIGDADIVLLPYRSAVFRTRTSGVFLDAVAAGKPVVATRATWAGDLIERFAIGTTYADGDVDELLDAVNRSIARLGQLQRRLRHRRREILARFAPARLVEFTLSEGAARRGRTPNAIDVARVRSMARAAVGEYWAGEHVEINRQISHQVRADDRARSRDEQRDESEPHERASRWGLAPVAEPFDLEQWSPMGKFARASALAAVTGLTGRELWREATASLDPFRLVAALILPARGGSRAGLMIDVGARDGVEPEAFRRAGWSVITVAPDPDRVDPIAFPDVSGIAHVDVFSVGVAVAAMEALDAFPWERLRPAAVMLAFDDHSTWSLGYGVRDLTERLVAYGYHAWISDWHPHAHEPHRPGWHRLVAYVGSPVTVQAEGHVVGFLDPVPTDLLGAALTETATVETRSTTAGAQRSSNLVRSITNGDDPTAATRAT